MISRRRSRGSCTQVRAASILGKGPRVRISQRLAAEHSRWAAHATTRNSPSNLWSPNARFRLYTSSDRATLVEGADPALVAPVLRDDGFIALLALEELGHESRDLGGPLQWE